MSGGRRSGGEARGGGAPGRGGAPGGERRGAPQRIRIIGGRWKRTPLEVPDLPGLRPTPDRVRETLFNWLGQRLDGWRCLDAFAGTGALGFEAASRGAAQVLMIEGERRAQAAIARTIERLEAAAQIRLLGGDLFELLPRLLEGADRFDLLLLDPPFGRGLPAKALAALTPLLAPVALVYVEAEVPFVPPAGFSLLRADRAGQVHYHLLRRDDTAEPESL
ncbi:MAG: 16S rRNA (guanine(966)-N(2))-methyltransferase RsmD [Burkholderiaceae bacterium]